MRALDPSLIDETARRYAACGIRHREFVRGKLRYDPMYAALLDLLEGSPGADVVDLGCGRGIALALLDTAWRRGAGAGRARGALHGVERSAEGVRVARIALGESAQIVHGTLEAWTPMQADFVLMLDVLQYLPASGQERLLARTAAVLELGSRIVLREPNRGGGWRFEITRAAERVRAIARGDWRQRYHYRSGPQWVALLASLGFEVRTSCASAGTPFDNLMLDAQRTARAPSTVKVDGSIAPGSASRISITSGLP